jgi:hypothetical protein
MSPMPKKKRPELTDQERAKRLKETAREVEAEATGEAFRRAFKAVTADQKGRKKSSPSSSRAG